MNKLSLSDKKQYSDILLALAGTFTEPKYAVKALTHAVNGAIQGRLLKSFSESWKALVDNGKLKGTFIENPWTSKQFAEIVKELNRDDIDEQRAEAMTNVFINSAMLDVDDIEAMRVVEILKKISNLNSLDIYILRQIDILRNDTINNKHDILYDSSASSWKDLILKRTKLELIELIEVSEDKLINEKLLTGRIHNDRSGVNKDKNYRLTEFGIRLCRYMREPKILA